MMMKRTQILIVAACLACGTPVQAQSTAFMYQGRLDDGVGAANGSYDLTFGLFDAPGSGTQQGLILTNTPTAVSNGLFTVLLDFGNQFPGANRWLEIGVRTNGSGPFATLSPRQPLAPTPYAIQAGSANAVAAANIRGSIALGQLPSGLVTNGASGVNFSGTFAGNGAGMTNVDLMNVADHGAIQWTTNDARFSPPMFLPVGIHPVSIAAADVNGDGKVDLISANNGEALLKVLTNNGSGGFAMSTAVDAGRFPAVVIAADVNGDGKVDLITANGNSTLLTVFTNNGSGGFVTSTTADAIGLPVDLAAADVNGDGKVDLISAGSSINRLTVLTNNGGGRFVASSSPIVGSLPYRVIVADVNGDGKADLISVNSGASTLTVLTNNGFGGFVLSSSPAVGSEPHSVTAADVNGDGKVDLISANYADSTLTVLTNNGSGGFVLSSSPVVGHMPNSVTAADMNGDGKVDLISADYADDTLTVLTNNGSGGFAVSSSPFVGLLALVVISVDVNGDGKADLISAKIGDSSLTLLLRAPPAYGGIFSGDGSGLTSLAVSNITGILGAGQIPSLDAAKIASGTFGAAQIPDLDAAKIKSGILGDARLSTNVALLSASQTFTGANVISNSVGQPELMFRGNSILRLLAFDNGNYIQSAAANTAGSTNDLYFTGLFGAPVQMVVKANGSVGIGTASPKGALHVAGGGVAVSGSSSPYTGAGAGIFMEHSGAGGMLFAFDYAAMQPRPLLLNSPGGNVGIGTSTPANRLHVVGGITCTALTQTSDRNAKENFAPVSPQEILEKVAALPITTWNFKALGDGRHIGPMAQDFHAAFGLGGSDTTITSVDPDGVALAAIQGLNERSQKAEASLQALTAENAELKVRLERLERLLAAPSEGTPR